MSFLHHISGAVRPMGSFPVRSVLPARLYARVHPKNRNFTRLGTPNLQLAKQILSESNQTPAVSCKVGNNGQSKHPIFGFTRAYTHLHSSTQFQYPKTKKMSKMGLLLAGALIALPIASDGMAKKELSAEQIHVLFYDALQYANRDLEQEGVVVTLKQQVPQEPKISLIDPSRNLLLEIQVDGQKEPIDIVSLECPNDKGCIKTNQTLSNEIVNKVKQHLAAKKTAGICISASGSKFDTRALKENRVSIDSEGYLTVNGLHVIALINEKPEKLHAERLRSYSILRLIEKDGVIRIFDEYDLIRPDKKGMYIDLNGPFPLIKRDELTDTMKLHLKEVLANITAR